LTGRQVRRGDGDAWQHAAAGVFDHTEDRAARNLRARKRRGDNQAENDRDALDES